MDGWMDGSIDGISLECRAVNKLFPFECFAHLDALRLFALFAGG